MEAVCRTRVVFGLTSGDETPLLNPAPPGGVFSGIVMGTPCLLTASLSERRIVQAEIWGHFSV
jgi:hypothetical protein